MSLSSASRFLRIAVSDGPAEAESLKVGEFGERALDRRLDGRIIEPRRLIQRLAMSPAVEIMGLYERASLSGEITYRRLMVRLFVVAGRDDGRRFYHVVRTRTDRPV